MPNTPVSPGDPLLPSLTAPWYNSTLPKNDPQAKGRSNIFLPREGELLGIAKDSDGTRFNPVAVTTLGNEEEYHVRTPYVSTADLDQHNWIIPQEDLVEGGAVMCVVFGLTRAWVSTTRASDNCVIYDPVSSTLITAKEGKAQILVKGGSSFPSLINIGVQCNCIRVVGTLTSTMPAVAASYGISNLKGVNFTAQELSTSISAYNAHRFEADSGALVRAEWVYDNARWEIFQVSC